MTLSDWITVFTLAGSESRPKSSDASLPSTAGSVGELCGGARSGESDSGALVMQRLC